MYFNSSPVAILSRCQFSLWRISDDSHTSCRIMRVATGDGERLWEAVGGEEDYRDNLVVCTRPLTVTYPIGRPWLNDAERWKTSCKSKYYRVSAQQEVLMSGRRKQQRQILHNKIQGLAERFSLCDRRKSRNQSQDQILLCNHRELHVLFSSLMLSLYFSPAHGFCFSNVFPTTLILSNARNHSTCLVKLKRH